MAAAAPPDTIAKVRRACDHARAGGWAELSTGEQLLAALTLNRPDWLAATGHTIATAIEWVGPTWLAAVLEVARASALSITDRE